ncbi:MAG: hypothetical protein GX666_08255 [Tissierellia bacterium]|nr:hypothetical protein [Tissierellia bacterium]
MNLLSVTSTVVILAILVEALINIFETLVVDQKIQWQYIGSILLGIIICVAYKGDLLTVVGLSTTIPYLNYILTGIVISRGANYTSDLLDKLNNSKGE